MKKTHILPLILCGLLSWSLASCNTSDDPSDYTEVKDCAITAVTLGTLHRTVYAKSPTTGIDTTYAINVSGTLYPMYIDQINNRIYNADSLPMNTRVDKVVFNTLNGSGTITIQSLTTGKDTLFVSTDSTDFTRMRQVKVYSSDASMTRIYDFEVNVHKEEADSFVWKSMASGNGSLVAGLSEVQLLNVGETLYAFGLSAEGKGVLTTASTIDGMFSTWAELQTPSSAIDIHSVRYFANEFHALADGALMHSADGIHWSATEGAQPLKALAAASSDSLYAVGEGRKMLASADGVNWNELEVDHEGTLPTANTSAALCASHTDSNISTMVLIGDEADGTAVWKHDIDKRGDYHFPWIYLPQTEELKAYACPVLKQPSLLSYDGAAVLIGLTSEGNASPLYQSADLGRTWVSTTYTTPSIARPTCISATVDADHHLWVVCGGTGEVWRGRINRLAWEKNKTVILKSKRK